MEGISKGSKKQDINGEFDSNQEVTKKINNKSQMFQQYVLVPPNVDEDEIGEGEGENQGDSDDAVDTVQRKSTSRKSILSRESSGLFGNIVSDVVGKANSATKKVYEGLY